MASANVLITYTGDATELKASLGQINQANDEIEASAKETSQNVINQFKNTGKAITAAFTSTQVKNALDNLNKESKELTAQLKKLEDEQLSLLATGNRLSKAYKENAAAQSQVKSSLVDVNREIERFAATTDEADGKQKSLTGQLRALKQELAQLEQQGKENTAEFEQLLFSAAKLEDQIGDTRERVRVLASDTFKFDAAVGAVQGLTAGFEIAQGAAALFGDENKDLQEIINKTTAVTAIANGVQQLASVVTGQAAAKLGFLSIAKKVYTFATTGATAATKAFRAAIVSTGVGALVVALGFLIEKLLSTSESSNETTESLKRLKQATEEAATSARKAANERAIAAIKLEQAEGKGNKAAQDAAIRKLETDGAIIDAEEDKNKRLTEAQERYLEEFKKIEDNADADDRTKAGLKIKAIEARDEQIANITQESADKIATIESNARTAELDAAKAAAKELADKQKEAREKASEAAKKAAADRLKTIEETIRVELLTEDEAVSERIKLAENLADQQKLDAQQNISDAKLRAATIKRIDAELASERQKILVEEQKRILDNEIQRLENLELAGQLEIQQAEELAQKRADLAKQDASLLTDPVARANAEKAAEVQLQNDLTTIRFNAAKQQSELELARLALLQKRGDFTIATEEAIANEQFNLRAEELKKEAAQTKEGQEKLTIDLLNNEADRQQKLAQIRADGVIKSLEIENLRIEALKVNEQASIEDRIKFIENEAAIKRKQIEKELISEEEKNAKIALLDAQTQKQIRDERQKTLDQTIEIAQATAQLFSDIVEIQGNQSQKRLEEIEQQATTEEEAIKNSELLAVDKERKLEALRLRTEQKIAAEKRKQAVAERAAAIFEATIATAVAIAKALPNPVTAAIAAAAGAAQVLIISSQPLPKFKKGGMVGGKSHEQGGTIIEAEKGEFIMNKNSTSQHRKALDAMNTSSAAFRKYIDDKYVRPAILDYAMKGKDKAVIVEASLNSKSMEKKLDKLNKSMKGNRVVVNINGNDSRYEWHNR